LHRIGVAIEKYPLFNKEKDALILPLDLTKFSTHTQLTSQVIQRFGKIDILVNNGGVSQTFAVEEGPLEVEKNLLDINLLGTISLTKAVLPHMLERRAGQIVVVSSVFGKFGFPRLAAYSASKFGLQGYFNTLRFETVKRNIKVLTVLFGPVLTDVLGNRLTNTVNLTYKETDEYKQSRDTFAQIKFMTAQRSAKLMVVTMANDLTEVWPSTQPSLISIYMAQYMPSIHLRVFEKILDKLT
ncbi:dehydrogenase/reductase SDR family member 7-like, partial [Actinia tenebrosa]|uniref:Dehydrogenase/reductase SDR family member 7-like n=1 Tax=Actinia tenebrosa TaxID=6105 RepID=A0A6P8IPN0_ACTTE